MPVDAQTFSNLLDRALATDPTYLATVAGVEIADAKFRQAVGGLLPQLSATANTNYNNRDYETRSLTQAPQQDRYNSNSSQISLTQPLWRYANIVGWQQAKAISAQAEYQLLGAQLDLFVRLTSAWCELMSSYDQRRFADGQLKASASAQQVAERGSELGTHSWPEAEEALFKYDQARAEAVAADAEVSLKLAALEQIVGQLPDLAEMGLSEDAKLISLDPVSLDAWLHLANSANPNVAAATQAFVAASDEVRKQGAGHQPTVDVVASYGKNSQAVGGYPGQAGYDIKTGSIGLQLNFPIFSGGAQSAKVAEALAQRDKSRHELEAARRATRLAIQQAWHGWSAAQSRVVAFRQAVRASRAALKAASVAELNGLKSEQDRLLAEQQSLAAIRDYNKARYDQISALVKLRAASGNLALPDVQVMDGLFSVGGATAEVVGPDTLSALGGSLRVDRYNHE